MGFVVMTYRLTIQVLKNVTMATSRLMISALMYVPSHAVAMALRKQASRLVMMEMPLITTVV